MVMRRDEEPTPHPLSGANDNLRPPRSSPKVEAALRQIARLIGRQMAREAFEVRRAANDNGPSRNDGT